MLTIHMPSKHVRNTRPCIFNIVSLPIQPISIVLESITESVENYDLPLQPSWILAQYLTKQ